MRRPAQGEAAIQGDIVNLTRCMRRIEGDTERSAEDKRVLVTHLKAVIARLCEDGAAARRTA